MKKEKCQEEKLKEKVLLLQKNDEHKDKRKIKRSVKERGITLIALVITIIILLILAGVTLGTTLGENGLLQRARQAREAYKKAEEEESQGIEELIKEMGENGESGESGGKTPGTTEPTESPEPSESTEPTTTPEASPSTEPTPTPGESAGELNSKVENNPGSVLGKEVTGLTLATGLSETYQWQIFDVDLTHIWLITKDYIKTADCPQTNKESNVGTKYDYEGNLLNPCRDYTGASDIKDKNIQNLNSKFFEDSRTKNSTYGNAKSVAYLLDKDIWTTKFIGNAEGNDKVEYVVGAPTIEQIFRVYNKKHSANYQAKIINEYGYQISENGSKWDWRISGMLGISDPELVINNQEKTNAMWVASPFGGNQNSVILVKYDGSVDDKLTSSWSGFRPVVSLKSTVHLEESNGGYVIK